MLTSDALGSVSAVMVESRMEYYWELRSNNAQNIKTLMYLLYKYARLRESGEDRFARADTQSIKQQEELM